MDVLLKKFSEAAKMISSEENPIRESVHCAYVDHLSDIKTDDLPEDLRIIYESVVMRIKSTIPFGDVDDNEAAYLAKDILYMADVLKEQFQS